MIVSIEICTGKVYNFLVALDMIINLMALYICFYINRIIKKHFELIIIFFNERFLKIFVAQPQIIIRIGLKKTIDKHLIAQNPPSLLHQKDL